MDFFARQEAARRATRWLLIAFLVSLVLVVAAIAGVVFALLGGQGGREPETATVWATVAGMLAFFVIGGASLFKTLALRAGGGVVARSLGGTRVERGTRDPGLRRLHNVVEEMAIASGVTMPEVYVLEQEDGINAFAAGNSPADAAVAVTRGAITRLNREELQGVIAHEFSHVLNGDMRLNSRLLGWVFGLLVIAIAARILLQGIGHGRRNQKGAPFILIALAVMAVGYIGVFVGRVLQAAVSRHRERLADASAVQFTRNPGGLVGALLKIGGVSSGSNLASPEKEEVAHMLFAPGMARMFSTHPPLLERVEALDPAFKRSDFAARTALAAREAEQHRLAPSFAARMDSNVLTSELVQPTPLATATVAARVASLTGTFDETQQKYAHEARQAIPEELHAYADSPDGARALLFALLRGSDNDVVARQDEVVRRVYGEPLLQRVRDLGALTRRLPPALRLPAVQQLFPAIRRMTSEERQEFRAAIQQLVLADDRVDVFECCLMILLEGVLREYAEGGEEHGGQSLLQQARPAAMLFAILARRGSGDRGSAQAAYDAGIAHTFPHHRQPYASVERWPEALRQSLRELTSLRPSAKKVLIEGLVQTVAHDRRLSVAEGELLRTVCATLHCPLPPILSAQ